MLVSPYVLIYCSLFPFIAASFNLSRHIPIHRSMLQFIGACSNYQSMFHNLLLHIYNLSCRFQFMAAHTQIIDVRVNTTPLLVIYSLPDVAIHRRNKFPFTDAYISIYPVCFSLPPNVPIYRLRIFQFIAVCFNSMTYVAIYRRVLQFNLIFPIIFIKPKIAIQ